MSKPSFCLRLLVLLLAACGPWEARAQVIQLAFEKHTIIAAEFNRRTNVVTTSIADVPVTIGGGPSSRAKFAGTLKLNFPALIANVTNYSAFEPVPVMIGVNGSCTISNRFNEQNFGAANYLVTQIRTFNFPCRTLVTNGPPMGAGDYPIDVKAECATKALSSVRKEPNGFDHIVEFEFEVTLTYRNQSSELESLRFIIQSRYRAPGGPYLFASTNLISLTSNRRFPQPSVGVGIFNQGTGDLHYRVAGGAPWLNISGSGTVARNQSATVSATISTNGLARGMYESAITITGDGAQPSVTIPVRLTVLGDEVRIVTIDPPPGADFPPGSAARFEATVEGVMETVGLANLILRIRDQNLQTLRATSITLNREGSFRTNLVVPDRSQSQFFIPSTTTKLVVQAILLYPFDASIVAESSLAEYPVVTKDEISQANPHPALTESIAAGSVTNFSADVTYSLQSSAEADLALRVFDQDGNLQTTSRDPANPSRLLRVRRSDGQKTIRVTTPDFTVPRKAINLTVRAVLIDPVSGSILKASAGNVYRVGPYAKIKKIEFGIFRDGAFGAMRNQTPPLEAGVPFHKQLLAGGGYRTAIAVTYDFEPRDRDCELRMIRGHTKVGGRTRVFEVGTPSYSPEGGETLRPGLDQKAFVFDPFEGLEEPPDDVEFLEFGVGIYEDFTELAVRFLTASGILRMPINRLRIVGEAIPVPDATLVAGRPIKFSVPLELNFQGTQPSRKFIFEARVNTQAASGKTAQLVSRTELATIPINTFEPRYPEVTLDVPADANYIAVQYFLVGDPNSIPTTRGETAQWARSPALYYHVVSAPLAMAAAANQNFDFRSGQLLGVTSAQARTVAPRLGFDNLKSVVAGSSPSAVSAMSLGNLSNRPGEIGAADFLEQFIGSENYVQFTPPIAENSGFSATLVLRYDRSAFPDHPNFTEPRMEIVSVDPASGIIRRHPTLIDTANQTATTTLSGLAPYYGLGVFAPPTAAMNFPAATSSPALDGGVQVVNLSFAALTLDFRAETGADVEFPTNSTAVVTQRRLSPGQMLALPTSEALSTNGTWLQVRSVEPVAASWQTFARNGRVEELAALESRDTAVVLPNILETADVGTELHLANTSRSRNRLTLELYDAQGRLAATNAVSLMPKARFARRVADVFGLTNSFAGYLIARGGQELSALQLRVAPRGVTALNALPLVPADGGPIKLVGPHFDLGSRHAHLLSVVNPTGRSVSLRVLGVGDTGNNLVNPVTLNLSARQQVETNVSQLLGLTSSTAALASVVVESPAAGVVATLTALDAAGMSDFYSIVPLASRAITHGVFPLGNVAAGAAVELAIFNAGSSPANVTVRTVRANGEAFASTNLVVANGGRITQRVPSLVAAGAPAAAGYAVIEADQPLFASAQEIDPVTSAVRNLPVQAFTKLGLRLDVSRTGNEIVLSWPASEPGYVLETTGALPLASSWQAVPNVVTLRGDLYTVTLPIDTRAKFYRLIRR